MKIKLTGLICLTLFTTVAAQASTTTQWECTKNADGIMSFVGSNKINGIAPTKVEMTVAATPEKVLGVIADFSRYDEWLPHCEKSYFLQRISDTISYGYIRLSPPLVTDRDAALRCTILKTSEKNYEVLVTAVPNFIHEEKNALRIQHMVCRYNLRVEPNGKTFISQTNEVNIGGSIPNFLINWSNNSQPFETFQRLRKLIVG
jgi:hypothetical protein